MHDGRIAVAKIRPEIAASTGGLFKSVQLVWRQGARSHAKARKELTEGWSA